MIYYVEDNDQTRKLVEFTLSATGYEVKGFESAAGFWAELGKRLPELVILDIMLPDEDGMQILARLKSDPRTMGVPVIMLSAKEAEYDKVMGLTAGADDYVTKPFGAMELVARVKAVLRRAAPMEEAPRLTVGEITLDAAMHTVIAAGAEVELTFKEFELLRHLMQNRGIAFSREQLLDAIWGMDYFGGTRTVDVHMQTLRKKLGACGEQIKTIYGLGYRMEGKRHEA